MSDIYTHALLHRSSVEHFPGTPEDVAIAASLIKLDNKNRITVRCLNTRTKPLTLKAGTVLGICTPVAEDNIHDSQGQVCQVTKSNINTTVDQHVKPLFEGARNNCLNQAQEEKLAHLLNEYADVFSKDD